MKNSGILNAELISAIAAIGHTQYFMICDAGLPIPDGVKVIDLSVESGIPGFMQVLKAVNGELVSESYLVAEELKKKNPRLEEKIRECMGGKVCRQIPHEELKKETKKAQVIVRTGETSPYANILLVAGVNF